MKKLKTLITSSISRLTAIPLAVKSGILFVKSEIDIKEIHVYGGILSIGYGCYLISPAYGFISAGLILLFIGLFYGVKKK